MRSPARAAPCGPPPSGQRPPPSDSSVAVGAPLHVLHRVDPPLGLGGGGPLLEAHDAVLVALVQLLQGLHANVLQRLPEAHVEVGEELVQRSLVHNRPRHPLLDTDRLLGIDQVPRAAPLVHRLLAPHPPVLLHPLPVPVKPLPGRLVAPREHRAHHDAARTEAQSLDDVTRAADPAVGDARDAKLPGEARDLKDGHGLGPAASHHLLRRADASHPHTHAQPVAPGRDEVGGLPRSDHVAPHHLDPREVCLDPPDHVGLERRVPLGAVDDNDVHVLGRQGADARAVRVAGADGGAAEELLGGFVDRGHGVVPVLQEIRAGYEGNELPLTVDDGKLADLGALHKLVGFCQGASLPGNH
mmetsp:Transcript_11460/g.28494  ORF Transcript_11460/g.28494 Transcript_11460/m.28494 type:complete len:357 (-) Transcript_11460:845-1915(-)